MVQLLTFSLRIVLYAKVSHETSGLNAVRPGQKQLSREIWNQAMSMNVKSDDGVADTIENTRRFNAVFADIVRRHPEQWIWMHKRWRTRPPGEPPIY